MNANATRTKYTITAAHRITGKSRTTLQKHLKKGKLSCEETDDGIKLIDASELIRAYGDACDFTREEGATIAADVRDEGTSSPGRAELDAARAQLENLAEERRREREQLQSQIEHLRDALKLSMEGHNRATLLLERKAEPPVPTAVPERREEIAHATRAAHEEARRELLSRPWWRLLWT